MMTDAVPPHDAQAEESVIGAVLNRNEILDSVIEETAADEFYREGYKIIFDGMVKLAEAHEPIDPVLLRAVIGETEWKRIDGDRLCVEAVANVPTSVAGPYYAREVHNRYIQRSVMSLGREMYDRAGTAPAGGWSKDWTDELIAELEYGVAQIVKRQISTPEVSQKDATAEVIHKLKHGSRRGIATGFANLDRVFGGFDSGHLTILAARTSKGKTALSTCFALNIAKAGTPVGYFTLEMKRDEMIERCLGTLAQVDMFEAHRLGLRADRAERIDQAQTTLNSLPLRLLYRPAMTPRDFRLECRKLMREMGLRFAVVDYFNLMRGNYHSKERWREMMEVILAMKECAGELDIPILLLSQINREGTEDTAPTLSQLRDTGSAEEHSSNVLLLWQKPRKEGQTPYDAEQWEPIEVIIGKQRNGPVGRDIGLKFRKQWGSFIDA